MAENIALWTILCVLVVLILVLSANLLASCGRRKGGLTAAAVGGGLALSWGGRALSQAHGAPPRALLHGGGLDDINKLEESLNFPSDQAAAEKEHQDLRQQVKTSLSAYERARKGKLGEVATETDPTKRPARGWAITDPLAITVKDSFILMCEAMRGEFPSGGPVVDGPWNNPRVPGPNSRMNKWLEAKSQLNNALNALAPLLVKRRRGGNLPIKTQVESMIPLLAKCNPPVIHPPSPFSTTPLSVIATSTHHSEPALQNVQTFLQNALNTYSNDNLSAGADLRAGKVALADPGSCIDVAKCDALVTQAINEFETLVPLYLMGSTPAHENVNNAITTGQRLHKILVAWVVEISLGELGTSGALHTAYKALNTMISDVQAAVAGLNLPPLPAPPDLETLSMVNDTTHPKAIVVAGTDNRIGDLRAWLLHVLTIYNNTTVAVGSSNLRSGEMITVATATVTTGLHIDVKAADAAVTKVIGEFNKLAACYAAATPDTFANIAEFDSSRQGLRDSLIEWSKVINAKKTASPLDAEYISLLVSIGGPADAHMPTVQAAVNGLIIPPLPAPPGPATLAPVEAVTHDKAGAIPGSNLLEVLRNELFNVSTTYSKSGLREGNMDYPVSMLYFDIEATDQLVTDIIASFNTLEKYYVTGILDTYNALVDSRSEINKLQSALTKWATNIEGAATVAAIANPTMADEYRKLVYVIGGTGVSTSIPASARHGAGTLTLPNPPPFPDPSIISVLLGPSGKAPDPIFGNFTNLYNELVNTVKTYGDSDLAITVDLRRGEPGPKRVLAVDYSGPYFNVEQSDKHANEVITAFNNLKVLYQDAPSSPGDGVAFSKEIADAKTALTAWVTELATTTAGAPEPLKTGYRALIASVGTLQVRFDALAPPVPDYKYIRTAKPLAKVDQPKNISDLVINTSKNLNMLLGQYNQCCALYLLNWGVIGPVIKAVDDAFDVLQDSYDVTPRNIAAARQTAINKKILVAALTSLQAATKVDPTFARALTNPIADGLDKGLAVLIGDVSKNVLTGATLSDGGIISGMKIRDHTRLKDLADPLKYPKYFMKDIGVKCRILIGNTIMDRKKKSIITPGLRSQINTLWTKFRIDPVAAEKDLFQIESDVEDMATICLKYAKTGDPTLIPSGEAVKKTLLINLAALETKVQIEPLLEDDLHELNAGLKKVFTAAIKAVSDALEAIILIWASPPGLARGMSTPTRLPPLPDSIRLIHYERPPTDTLGGIFQNVSDIPAGSRNDVVIVAQNEKDLDSKANLLSQSGPRLTYGLIIHHPGDMVALYKAVAICLKQAPPPEIAAKNANRKTAATGWLYDIVRFESGGRYMRLRDYIKPELYAIDT